MVRGPLRVALIAVSMVVVLRTLMHLHAAWWAYAVIVGAGVCFYVVGMGDGRLAAREEQLERQVESRTEDESTGV